MFDYYHLSDNKKSKMRFYGMLKGIEIILYVLVMVVSTCLVIDPYPLQLYLEHGFVPSEILLLSVYDYG